MEKGNENKYVGYYIEGYLKEASGDTVIKKVEIIIFVSD